MCVCVYERISGKDNGFKNDISSLFQKDFITF